MTGTPYRRHPAVICTRPDCPYAKLTHYVERVPKTPVRVHYEVNDTAKVVTVLWIHEDGKPWPDEAERERIWADHVREGLG